MIRQQEIKEAQRATSASNRRLAKARKQVEDHTKSVTVSAEKRMQEAEERQLAHAEKRRAEAHEANTKKNYDEWKFN